MKLISSKVSIILAFIYVLSLSLSSCSSSESVVSNSFLQKRKYNKGFHRSSKTKIKTKKVKNEEVLVLNVITDGNEETKDKVVFKTENTEVENVVLAETRTSTEEKELVLKDESLINIIEESQTVKEKVVSSINNRLQNIKSVVKNKSNHSSNIADTNSDMDTMFILLIILAFIIPPLAVGIYTDIDWLKVLIAFLLWSSFFVSMALISLGIIYALLVIFDIL